uniref:(northern house mosquito) hypothetical protein n=1 Tax=Culex pipiens TaxID=7175 RepID=A0A8D8KPU0_CULPI
MSTICPGAFSRRRVWSWRHPRTVPPGVGTASTGASAVPTTGTTRCTTRCRTTTCLRRRASPARPGGAAPAARRSPTDGTTSTRTPRSAPYVRTVRRPTAGSTRSGRTCG